MEIALWTLGISYAVVGVLAALILLIPYSMMSGDPIPPKHWVWLFYIPNVITWPLTPLWIMLLEWIAGV